jgi:uncharacterized protein (DUF4415 family)
MFEWDKPKAKANQIKHGISFPHVRPCVARRGNMKAKYDFNNGKRGAVLPPSGNKVRITIRLDRDIVEWFRSKVEEQGGGNYQSMLNDALRIYMERQDQSLEEVLRRVVREELQACQ